MRVKISAKDLLKTDSIITCSPSDTLSQALAKLSSSHDAVFVTDDEDKLLGVISPYYVLFQANLPPTTKVKNCLYSPPKIQENTSLWEIARNMMESKVYYLPVFSQSDKWIGIVAVRRLFNAITKDKELMKKLDVRRRINLETISQNATLAEARALLSNKGFARLPVINKSGKLIGILTRYDLREALSQPKSSQRFLSRAGEKRKLADKPIRGYFKNNVVTATEKTPLAQMISTMLEKQIGSIVIVNQKWQPTGILTYRDLLKSIASQAQLSQTTLDLTLPEEFKAEAELLGIIRKFTKKMLKRTRIHKIEANIQTIKNPSGKDKVYKAKILSYHPKESTCIGEAEGFRWKTAVRKALAKIEKQIKK